MTLTEQVGQRIREFRTSYGGGVGISRDALAKAVGVSSNTVSRWETSTYKPTIEDLDRLARFSAHQLWSFSQKKTFVPRATRESTHYCPPPNGALRNFGARRTFTPRQLQDVKQRSEGHWLLLRDAGVAQEVRARNEIEGPDVSMRETCRNYRAESIEGLQSQRYSQWRTSLNTISSIPRWTVHSW